MLDLMSEVTRILSAIEQGDPHAAGKLLPLVHHRQRLPLGLKAGYDLLAVQARFEDFERHLAAARALLFGHEHDPEAFLANLLCSSSRTSARSSEQSWSRSPPRFSFEPGLPARPLRCTKTSSTPGNTVKPRDTWMSRIFHPLLSILVSATRQQLARQVHYLKIENQILRNRLP